MYDKTPREVLSEFYKANNLEFDGGETSKSVKIELSAKFHFYFPNFDARRKAVVKHDIHHILTGYETTVAGESEISAWEIASGCRDCWVAFFIDTSGFMLGLLINFRGVLKAFARGRKTRNLYHNIFTTHHALDMSIDELRFKLYLDKYPKDSKVSFVDLLLFAAFSVFGLIYSVALVAFLPFIFFYSLYIMISKSSK
ncbi:MAG: hypothetical protein H0W84_14335 [Bacteroidetes bacterium]|nr:hypothetical protein [Bacteroidota bacterium]